MRMFKVGGIGCAIVGAMCILGGIGCLAMSTLFQQDRIYNERTVSVSAGVVNLVL